MPTTPQKESSPGILPRGRLEKQNPEIALKVLRYLKTNPDCFHPKWKDLEKGKFLQFVKYLATDCGCDMYLKRAEDPNGAKRLQGLYENLKKW